MAILKVIHGRGKYHDRSSFHDLTQYATRSDKTTPDLVLDGSLFPEIAAQSMQGLCAAYQKPKGTNLRHSVLSFSPEESVTAEQAADIAREAMEYYEEDYQIMAAVHTDRAHLHIHFIMNTTDYRTGKKYPGNRGDYYAFRDHVNKILRPRQLTVKLEK